MIRRRAATARATSSSRRAYHLTDEYRESSEARAIPRRRDTALGMTTSTTEVLLIADTHLRRGASGVLTSKIEEHLAAADAVLHAGDLTDCSVIEALRETAPHADVHAVAGNLDHGLDLPDRLVLDIDGCAVALVHDGGPARGRRRRLRRWFPDSDLVVFGHSHVPWHEVDVRPSDHHRQHQVNPGSAMLRRRSPTCTIARVVLAAGRVVQVRHVPIP